MTNLNTNNYPRLLILELRWNYNGERHISFNSGLVLLHGQTQALRTIFLRLIRYGLGGNAERIDSNVMESLDEIQLILSANDEIIVVTRSCRKPNGKLKILENDRVSELTPREWTEYLLDRLGMPKIYMTNIRQGKSIEVLLSFNDISRAIFVDRDISYPAILSEVLPTPRREIVKILLGLTTREVAETENLQRSLEIRQSQIQQELTGIRQFLASTNVPSRETIIRERGSLVTKLNSLKLREDELTQRMKNSINSNLVSDSKYTQLRDELLEKRQKLERQKEEILQIEHQQQQKRDIRTELENESRRLSRHLASHHVISSFTFSQCPRCLLPITSDMNRL